MPYYPDCFSSFFDFNVHKAPEAMAVYRTVISLVTCFGPLGAAGFSALLEAGID